MALSSVKLAQMISHRYDAQIQKQLGVIPSQQANPHYNKQFFRAISEGFVKGFLSAKGGSTDKGKGSTPPVTTVQTVKSKGPTVVAEDFSKVLYTNMLMQFNAKIGQSSYSQWPEDNPLKSLTDAIANGTAEHIAKDLDMIITHKGVYQGTTQIDTGNIFGIESDFVRNHIQSAGFDLKGPAWPIVCEALADAFTMFYSSTAVLAPIPIDPAGVCSPSVFQVCGIANTTITASKDAPNIIFS